MARQHPDLAAVFVGQHGSQLSSGCSWSYSPGRPDKALVYFLPKALCCAGQVAVRKCPSRFYLCAPHQSR